MKRDGACEMEHGQDMEHEFFCEWCSIGQLAGIEECDAPMGHRPLWQQAAAAQQETLAPLLMLRCPIQGRLLNANVRSKTQA